MLNNGVMMPTIGFGTAGLGERTEAAVAAAVKAGYRHFDSAQVGGKEGEGQEEWGREGSKGGSIAA